jgi:hypothetical protein
VIGSKYVYIQVAILIGLVGIAVGFLIENTLRSDQQATELEERLETDAQRIAESLRQISPVAQASTELRDFIGQVARAWTEIDRRGKAAILSEIHHDKAQEYVSLLTDLAAGVITVGIDGPYSVRLRSFEDVRSYRAASMGPLEFWTTNFGRNYLEAQRRSIESNKLTVERVFLLEDEQIDTAEPILRAQASAGIQVWVLRRRSVPEVHKEHIIDQGIIQFKNDQKLLMRPMANHYQEQADRERLSAVRSEIVAAEFSLSILRVHAVSLQSNTSWPFLLSSSADAPSLEANDRRPRMLTCLRT